MPCRTYFNHFISKLVRETLKRVHGHNHFMTIKGIQY